MRLKPRVERRLHSVSPKHPHSDSNTHAHALQAIASPATPTNTDLVHVIVRTSLRPAETSAQSLYRSMDRRRPRSRSSRKCSSHDFRFPRRRENHVSAFLQTILDSESL